MLNFSASAEEITGIAEKDLLAKNINDLLNNHIISSIYGNGNSATNHVVSLELGKLVVSRIPIFSIKKKKGLIIKIQKVAHIQALEQELRKDLLRKASTTVALAAKALSWQLTVALYSKPY